MPAAANSAAATASASAVSPARLSEGRPAPAAVAGAAFLAEGLGSEGADRVNVLGAALGTAARLAALVGTAVAAVAVAALAAISPFGAGVGAAITALGVAAAPWEAAGALLLPDLPKVTLAEVDLNAAGAAAFLLEEEADLGAAGLPLLLLLVLALGLLAVFVAEDLMIAGALPAAFAAAVSDIGDFVLTTFTPLLFFSIRELRSSPWPVDTGARDAARAGVASPSSKAAARPAAARAEPKLCFFPLRARGKECCFVVSAVSFSSSSRGWRARQPLRLALSSRLRRTKQRERESEPRRREKEISSTAKRKRGKKKPQAFVSLLLLRVLSPRDPRVQSSEQPQNGIKTLPVEMRTSIRSVKLPPFFGGRGGGGQKQETPDHRSERGEKNDGCALPRVNLSAVKRALRTSKPTHCFELLHQCRDPECLDSPANFGANSSRDKPSNARRKNS